MEDVDFEGGGFKLSTRCAGTKWNKVVSFFLKHIFTPTWGDDPI